MQFDPPSLVGWATQIKFKVLKKLRCSMNCGKNASRKNRLQAMREFDSALEGMKKVA
jgi:hypothetical protein